MSDRFPSAPPAAAPRPRAAVLALALTGLWLAAACVPDPVSEVLPPSDLKPPLVLEAGPEGGRSFVLRFDEEVRPVEGSFGLEPGPLAAGAAASGELLRLGFPEDLEPGADYAVSGEVEDAAGNATRFLFRFAGWNGRPAGLRLSELQAAKNSSASRPHRDFVELEVLEAGNLGGLELSWASSVKRFSYRFPGAEVAAGDFVVLHLAPEGLAEERDEPGNDLSLSGGVDARPGGRDFWSAAGGLPDQCGAVALALRAGEPPVDALFYAEASRSGELGDDKLAALVSGLGGVWPLASERGPAWEDAFRWKPSSARSICRRPAGSGEGGAEDWYVSASSGQSPGEANAQAPEP